VERELGHCIEKVLDHAVPVDEVLQVDLQVDDGRAQKKEAQGHGEQHRLAQSRSEVCDLLVKGFSTQCELHESLR
jgi:hypothetical protein